MTSSEVAAIAGTLILPDSAKTVSTLLYRPSAPTALLVLGHGAGAGMSHPFMEALAARLADRQIATFRYNFPFIETKRRFVGSQDERLSTVAAAVSAALALRGNHAIAKDLAVFAGGKSMGGRMASLALAQDRLPAALRGLIFYGFPLHPPNKPASERGDHLREIERPMLFLQGDRDALADLTLIEPLCATLPRATLQIVSGADHGFHVLKRSGRTDDEVLDQLARLTAEFCARCS
ncbi:MAG: dienelactone hydrolase family protein [Deltaproteobacteria bacterium]|nr:dienelactone hydrolase family protein [Deltaproteobacteria bacterium]